MPNLDCDCCSNDCNEDNLETVNSGDLVCLHCVENYYFLCDGCNEIYSNDSYAYDGYCENCKDKNGISHITDYCDSRLGELLNYHSKPSLDFHKMPYENTMYLGVELEITSNSPGKVAQATNEGFNRKFYIEEDTSCGFEIVFTPMTLEYWRKQNVREWLSWLKKTGAISYDNGKCGLHVHVSRKGLDKRIEFKLTNFLSTCCNQLKKFSKREEDKTDYCRFPDNSRYDYECKYSAINFCNSQTIEFRLYRGTLDFDRFWASLQMTEAICSFCSSISSAFFQTQFNNGDTSKTWKTFIKYLKRENRYTHLYRYLYSEHKKECITCV